VFSKVVWAGRARALVFALVIMAAALVASLLALTVTTRSAEAAFDGDNGLIVFYSERDRKPGDIFAMSSTGDAVKRLTTFATGGSIDPAVSPDGSRIAFSRGGEIWVMNASGMNSNGTGATQITDNPTVDTIKIDPTWSPDGTRIAYIANSFDVDGQTDLEIWAINADGSGRKQLTKTTHSEVQPAWSPDGDRIAFVNDDRQDIYVMNSDGSGTAGNLTPSTATPLYQGIDAFPSWSPDGSQIIYSNNGGGDTDIYKMDTDPTTTDWFNLTDPEPDETDSTDTQNDTQPAWSPDGESITYVSGPKTNTTDRDIYVMEANMVASGSAIASGTSYDISPDWQPNHDPPCDVTGTNEGDKLASDRNVDEVICGLGGRDTMRGQDGDILMGGDDNDTLIVPSGRATLNGGDGSDTASFTGSATRISASLVTGFAQRLGTNPLEGTALIGVENLTGTDFNDVLKGSNVTNRLVGDDGADKLYGLGGNDRLDSRDGVRRNDRVDGGADTDTCTTDSEDVVVRCE
jgi:Tol biopolymer transport system component